MKRIAGERLFVREDVGRALTSTPLRVPPSPRAPQASHPPNIRTGFSLSDRLGAGLSMG